MDFEFFENLSTEEARLFLDNFLQESGNGFEKIAFDIQKSDIIVDYSIQSIPPVMEWILLRLKTVPQAVDESLPEWIRQSEDYIGGLFDFDENSKILVLRAAYYLGETFNRSSEKLSWAIGNTKYAQKNMPVITGFKYKKELPPLLISENMFRRIIEDESRLPDIQTAISSWEKNIKEK